MTDKINSAQIDLEYYFEIYPDLICIAGQDGFLKKINPAVGKLLGYSHRELYQSPLDSFIHPEDLELTKSINAEQQKNNHPLEYENRFLAKDGRVVWLSWTSVFIERDQIIFAIAKDITERKLVEHDTRFTDILQRLGEEQRARFSTEISLVSVATGVEAHDFKWLRLDSPLSTLEQNWLHRFESLVRVNASSNSLNLKFLSSEMAMSERQIYRHIYNMVQMTPKKLVTMIQMHMIWEIISSGTSYPIPILVRRAGFSSTTRFRKLFYNMYGIEVAELL